MVKTPEVVEAPIASLSPVRSGWLLPKTAAVRSIDALDGLRAIAILLVIWFHFNVDASLTLSRPTVSTMKILLPFSDVGSTGVYLFFVLSGFLLFLPYARALLGLQTFPSTRKFYLRRALRILPAYWLVLIIYLVLSVDPLNRSSSPLDTISHFFLLHNYNPVAFHSIHGVFWTMAIESQFYLLLPLIAKVLWRVTGPGRSFKRSWPVWLVCFSGPLLVGFLQAWATNHWPWLAWHITIFYVFNYLGIFMTGALAGLFYVFLLESKKGNLSNAAIERIGKRIGWVGLFLAVSYLLYQMYHWYSPDFVDQGGAVESFLVLEWLGLGYTGLMLGVLLGWPGCRRFLSSLPMRFIGLISYSLYLWHSAAISLTLQFLINSFHNDLLSYFGGFFLALLLALVVSYVFYRFVERPFIEFRRREH